MPDDQPETMEWRLRVPRWHWVLSLASGVGLAVACSVEFVWMLSRHLRMHAPKPGFPEIPFPFMPIEYVILGWPLVLFLEALCIAWLGLRLRRWSMQARIRATSDSLELWPMARGAVTVPWDRVCRIYYEYKHWGRVPLLPAVLVVQTDRRKYKIQQHVLPEAEEVARILSERLQREWARAR
jgi:hypothetical protein